MFVMTTNCMVGLNFKLNFMVDLKRLYIMMHKNITDKHFAAACCKNNTLQAEPSILTSPASSFLLIFLSVVSRRIVASRTDRKRK